ncbi:MAG: Fe-S cluster assembly protein IscX [Methylohalobius sp.]|nr:Fe-S cluster assembly protein IscX [Methylohalobius sp.]
MNWTDAYQIAYALSQAHPDVDPRYIRFTDLYAWILALEGFKGRPQECNEKVLEAIQMAWIEEVQ